MLIAASVTATYTHENTLSHSHALLRHASEDTPCQFARISRHRRRRSTTVPAIRISSSSGITGEFAAVPFIVRRRPLIKSEYAACRRYAIASRYAQRHATNTRIRCRYADFIIISFRHINAVVRRQLASAKVRRQPLRHRPKSRLKPVTIEYYHAFADHHHHAAPSCCAALPPRHAAADTPPPSPAEGRHMSRT